MNKSTKKIQILTYFNHHHKILYDLYFKPTYEIFLKKSFDLIVHYNNSISNDLADYGYTKKIWQQIIVDRFDIIIKHIENDINNDTISIFSDIDVIFFGDFYQELYPFIQNKQLSLWYMPESINADRHYINGGFFAFRHCSTSINFFQTVKNMLLDYNGIKNDQPLIQEYLKSTNAKYSNIMPYTVFNTNNCNINNNISLFMNRTLKAFHATSTHSVYSKILVLDRMSRLILPQLLNHKKIVHG